MSHPTPPPSEEPAITDSDCTIAGEEEEEMPTTDSTSATDSCGMMPLDALELSEDENGEPRLPNYEVDLDKWRSQPMRFGKYKGLTMGEMVARFETREYLRFVLKWDDLHDASRKLIEHVLNLYKEWRDKLPFTSADSTDYTPPRPPQANAVRAKTISSSSKQERQNVKNIRESKSKIKDKIKNKNKPKPKTNTKTKTKTKVKGKEKGKASIKK